MCIFHCIDTEQEIKVKETNDVCMGKTEKFNIERKERKTMLRKKMFKDQKNRKVHRAREKMSSFNIYRKLSRQYLYLLDKNNVIILRRYRQILK